MWFEYFWVFFEKRSKNVAIRQMSDATWKVYNPCGIVHLSSSSTRNHAKISYFFELCKDFEKYLVCL